MDIWDFQEGEDILATFSGCRQCTPPVTGIPSTADRSAPSFVDGYPLIPHNATNTRMMETVRIRLYPIHRRYHSPVEAM